MNLVGWVGAAVSLLMLSGCDQQDADPGVETSPSPESTFTARGTVISADAVATTDGSKTCTGDPASAHRDIREGARVTVSDADADLVASGKLGPGTKQGRVCRFPFEVNDVPVGGSVFTVRIAARSSGLNFARAEATSLKVTVGHGKGR